MDGRNDVQSTKPEVAAETSQAAQTSRWLDEERLQKRCRVQRCSSGEMLDLHATREPRRDDDGFGIGLAQRREESLLANEPRKFVVLFFVAERAGHPATASIQIDNLCTRDTAQKPKHRPVADQ